MWNIPKEEKASARAQGDGPVEALSSQHHGEYCRVLLNSMVKGHTRYQGQDTEKNER